MLLSRAIHRAGGGSRQLWWREHGRQCRCQVRRWLSCGGGRAQLRRKQGSRPWAWCAAEVVCGAPLILCEWPLGPGLGPGLVWSYMVPYARDLLGDWAGGDRSGCGDENGFFPKARPASVECSCDAAAPLTGMVALGSSRGGGSRTVSRLELAAACRLSTPLTLATLAGRAGISITMRDAVPAGRGLRPGLGGGRCRTGGRHRR